MPQREAELLAAIDAAPRAMEPYRAYAAFLRAQEDPRGALIDLQCDLELAAGDASCALQAQVWALLARHRDQLLGPLAGVPGADTHVTWRRGFLAHVFSFAQPASRAAWRRFVAHPAMRMCTGLTSDRWPDDVPPNLETVHLRSEIGDERITRLSRLTTLSITPHAGSRLAHPGLRRLQLRGDFALDALADADLPALEHLQLPRGRASGAQLLETIARLAERSPRLRFSLHGAPGRQALETMAPVLHRLDALSAPGEVLDYPASLPPPRRLYLAIHDHDHRLVKPLPATLPHVQSLDVCVDWQWQGAPHAPIQESDAFATLRTLRLSFWPERIAEAFVLPMCPLVEQLGLLPNGNGPDAVAMTAALVRRDVFPRVAHVTLWDARQAPPLAASPLAPRLQTLTFHLRSKDALEAWLHVRSSFPRLETLFVVLDPRLRAEATALAGGGHAVRFLDHSFAPLRLEPPEDVTTSSTEIGAAPFTRPAPRPAPSDAERAAWTLGIALSDALRRKDPEAQARVTAAGADLAALTAAKDKKRASMIAAFLAHAGDDGPLAKLGYFARELARQGRTSAAGTAAYLDPIDGLRGPARDELATLRPWIVSWNGSFHDGLPDDVKKWELDALKAHVASRFEADEARAAEPPATTHASAPLSCFVERVVLLALCEALASAGRRIGFSGSARAGTYTFDDEQELFAAITFSEAGIVGLGSHKYASQREVEAQGEDRDPLHFLGAFPETLAPLARTLAERAGDWFAFTAGFWVTPDARHFAGSDRGTSNGLELFEALGASVDEALFAPHGWASELTEQQAILAPVLAARAVRGGGVVSRDELAGLLTPRDEGDEDLPALEAMLAALGLRCALPLAEAQAHLAGDEDEA